MVSPGAAAVPPETAGDGRAAVSLLPDARHRDGRHVPVPHREDPTPIPHTRKITYQFISHCCILSVYISLLYIISLYLTAVYYQFISHCCILSVYISLLYIISLYLTAVYYQFISHCCILSVYISLLYI